MSSWTVVEFLDSKTVEAVPTRWLYSNHECFWPPMTRSKINSEIKNSGSPNTCWPLYSVRVFKDGTFDDYSTARRKAKKAEDTSDLNSEVECGPTKRKVKRKIFDSDSYSSDSEVESKKAKTVLPPPPMIILKDNTPKQNPSTASLIKVKGLTQMDSQNNATLINEDLTESLRNTPVYNHLEESPSTDNQINKCPNCKALEKKMDTFMNQMLRNMSILKANLLQIREDINSILLNNAFKIDEVEPFLQTCPLPISNEEQLMEVENFLQGKEHFLNAIEQMCKLGGSNPYDFIRRCFQQTFSDTIAKGFTYDGTKEKRAFKDLRLSSLFLSACDKRGTDRKTAEVSIRKWLRRASERCQSKSKTVNVNELRCGENETFNQNASPCFVHCVQRYITTCPMPDKPACECKEGFIRRTADGPCIPYADCRFLYT